jgi:hypothetical protein
MQAHAAFGGGRSSDPFDGARHAMTQGSDIFGSHLKYEVKPWSVPCQCTITSGDGSYAFRARSCLLCIHNSWIDYHEVHEPVVNHRYTKTSLTCYKHTIVQL